MWSKLIDLFKLTEGNVVSYRRLIRFFFLQIIAAAVVFLIVFIALIRQKGEVDVPKVNGTDLIDGISGLQARGLEPYIIRTYSKDAPRFEIISQRPEGGSRVKRGRKVQLTVSLGARVNKMPDFSGEEIYGAKLKLLELYSAFEGIPQIIEYRQFSTNLGKDLIITQLPKPGSRINPDVEVQFIVSRGISTNKVFVDMYRNKNYKDIQNDLESMDIDVRVRPKWVVNNRLVGKILSQSVKPGEALGKGDSILFEIGILKKPGSDQQQKPQEIYRIISLRVPYKSQRFQTDSTGNLKEQNVPQYPIPDEKGKFDKRHKDLIRKVTLIVKDELGTEKRLEEYMYAGKHMEIPYRSFGDGTISVYVDDSYFKSEDFTQ